MGPINRRRWNTVRRQALDRDGWRCCRCGRPGRLEVDHLKPLIDGGAPYHLDNLQALCRACHHAKTTGENRRRSGKVPGPERRAWKARMSGR